MIGYRLSLAFLPPSRKSSRYVPSIRLALTGRLLRSDSGSISSSHTMTGHGWYPRIATMCMSPGDTFRRSSGAFFAFLAGVFFLCSGMPAPDLRAFLGAGVPLVAGASEAGAASTRTCQYMSVKSKAHLCRLQLVGLSTTHLHHRLQRQALPACQW